MMMTRHVASVLVVVVAAAGCSSSATHKGPPLEALELTSSGFPGRTIRAPIGTRVEKNDGLWERALINLPDGTEIEIVDVKKLIAQDSPEAQAGARKNTHQCVGHIDDGKSTPLPARLLFNDTHDGSWSFGCSLRWEGQWGGFMETYDRRADVFCATRAGAGVNLTDAQIALARRVCESII